MKKLIDIIAKAIVCPLMDTHNIPFEIADYLVHRIFYLHHEGELDESRPITTKGCFLASNPEEAWELYREKTKDIDSDFIIEKDDFMMGLWVGNGSYLTTNGASVRHLKVEWFDEIDDFHMVEYEHKYPTKNVLRKETARLARQHNTWYLPMIDVMMDGAQYNPVTILRR